MKKIIIYLLLIMLVFVPVGCGDKGNVDDVPCSNNEDPQPDLEDNTKTLKTCSEILNLEGLKSAIYYYNEVYNDFNEEEKVEFKNLLKEEIIKRGNFYKELTEIPQTYEQAIPILDNANFLYEGIFNYDNNTFNVYKLNDDLKKKANKIKEDDVFTLATNYWISDLCTQLIGFIPVVEKDIYDIIITKIMEKDEADVAYIISYENYIKSTDTTVDLDSYSIFMCEDKEKLEFFKDAHKTTVMIPVSIIEEEVQDNTEETIPEDDIAVLGDKISNLVLKDYSGEGIKELKEEVCEFTTDEGEMLSTHVQDSSMAVFGTIYDVEIGACRLYTESNFIKEFEYESLTNTNLLIKNCPFNAELGQENSYAVIVRFYDADLNYHEIFFGDNVILSQVDSKDKVQLGMGDEPTKVTFNCSETAIMGTVQGSDDSLTISRLVDNYNDFVTEQTDLHHIYYDIDIAWGDVEGSTIPLWTSSNMYNIKLEKLNYGEVVESYDYQYRKHFKAGSWLIISDVLNDGESIALKFNLIDGTEKKISICADDSDSSDNVGGLQVKVE